MKNFIISIALLFLTQMAYVYDHFILGMIGLLVMLILSIFAGFSTGTKYMADEVEKTIDEAYDKYHIKENDTEL